MASSYPIAYIYLRITMLKCRINTENLHGSIEGITVFLPALPREGDVLNFQHGEEYISQEVLRVSFYTDIQLDKVEGDPFYLKTTCTEIWIETRSC